MKREIQFGKDNSLAEYIASGAFDASIDNMKAFVGRATGFDNWDNEQVFLPGLYLLGGVPGTGKTTFALQLLDNLAKGNEHTDTPPERCVFCAYEMSKQELTAKSIAREMRRMWFNNRDIVCLSSSQLRLGAGRFNPAAEKAQARLATSPHNLHIHELENVPLKTLLEGLTEEARAASAAGMNLSACVDYLQLVPVEDSKASAKERVDEIILSLKQFQRATNSTLIVISSLNRAACQTGATNLFSFKESGSIEYSADVVWLIERVDDENISLDKDSPRQIRLKCAKNRHGNIYTVDFDYFAQSDYFRGCPKREYQKKKKSHRDC